MAAGFSTALRNARANAITTEVGGGAKLEIYSGTRPATGGTEGTLLSVHTLATPFAPGASGGVLTATNPADVNAGATDTAAWARINKADGTTACIDLSVGVAGSGAEVIVNSTSFVSGVPVTVTSLVITEGNP